MSWEYLRYFLITKLQKEKAMIKFENFEDTKKALDEYRGNKLIIGAKLDGKLIEFEFAKARKNFEHDDRPWGYYDRFTLNEQTSVKLLYIKPGQKLSTQYHNHRDEFNRVIKGSATIQLGDETRNVKEGDEYWVPAGMVHTATAGDEEFGWMEISFGEFDENDIVRLHDKYGRVKKSP